MSKESISEEIIDQLKKHKETEGKLALARIEKKRKEKILKKKKEELDIKVTPNYSETGAKTNKISSQVENLVVNKNMEIARLEKEIAELEEKIQILELDVEEANIRLGSLTYLEKEVIEAYYIDGLSMQEIGENTYYKVKRQTRGRKAIKNLIKKIEKKLKKLEI